MVDILEKLSKFPISEWAEARVEIIRLRKLVSDLESGVTNTNTVKDNSTLPTGFAISSDSELTILKLLNTELGDRLVLEKAKVEELQLSLLEKSELASELESKVLEAAKLMELSIANSPIYKSLRDQISDLRSELMEKTLQAANHEADKLDLIDSKSKLAISLEELNVVKLENLELLDIKLELIDILSKSKEELSTLNTHLDSLKLDNPFLRNFKSKIKSIFSR